MSTGRMVTSLSGALASLGATLAAVLSKYRDVGMSTDTPHEVYLLNLSGVESPRDARQAVNAIAQLHAQARVEVVRDLLTEVFPYREDVLRFESSCEEMPTLAVEITTIETLAAAEAFFSDREVDASSSTTVIDLMLVITTPSGASLDVLSRVTQLVTHLHAPDSRFRVTMVELALGRLVLDDETKLRATSRLSRALLRDTPTKRTCNVSFSIPPGGADQDGVGLLNSAAVGELLQALCRIGSPQFPAPPAAERYTEVDNGDCSALTVEILCHAHPRVVAAWWSAVAYSRGYFRLNVDHLDFDRNEATETISTRYFALMILLLEKSDVRWLDWKRTGAHKTELNALESVLSAVVSGISLSKVLWDHEWSGSRHDRIFEIASLNKEIVKTYGWTMHDPGDGEWVDVFVPGFAQCSAKREQWNQVRHDIEPRVDGNTGLQTLCLHIGSRHDQVPENTAQLVAMITGSSLLHLTLKGTLITTPGLLSLLAPCPNLQHLKLDKLEGPHEPIVVDPHSIASRQLESLELTVHKTSTPTHFFDAFFGSLLSVVGANLTCLRIKNPVAVVDRSQVDAPILAFQYTFGILAKCCSGLKTLMLERLDIGGFDGLVAAYECETTSLSSLRLLECPFESTSLIGFAEALRNPSCRGAKRLDFLLIKQTSLRREDCAQLDGLDLQSIRALLATVRVNRTLKTLLLLAQRPTDDAVDAATVVDEFNSFRMTDRAAYETWCRMRAAVALVSVLLAHTLPWNDQVVRQILQFVPFDRRGIEISFK